MCVCVCAGLCPHGCPSTHQTGGANVDMYVLTVFCIANCPFYSWDFMPTLNPHTQHTKFIHILYENTEQGENMEIVESERAGPSW